jgi:glycosyltransferase involved in cell wall biosynthesis
MVLDEYTKVKYAPLNHPCVQGADFLICVRHVDNFCKNFKGRVCVLCQNFDKDENEHGKLINIGPFILEKKGTLISVSNHLMEINKKLLPDINHICIYNPIDDDLKEDSTPRNKNKLVYFSSPHKGFHDTVFVFNLLRMNIPGYLEELTFYYANPGYLYYPNLNVANAVNLGNLPFNQVIKHVREAFCVFYINRIFPETFGLIYAEANAVGTPVLTHDFGSAKEILHPNNLPIDCNVLTNVRDTFMDWYLNKPPLVTGVDKFRTSVVIKDWLNLIERV